MELRDRRQMTNGPPRMREAMENDDLWHGWGGSRSDRLVAVENLDFMVFQWATGLSVLVPIDEDPTRIFEPFREGELVARLMAAHDLTGAVGGWTMSGTNGIDSTMTIDFPQQPSTSTWKKYFSSQWIYGKYKDVFSTCVKGYCTTDSIQYGARPYRFNGGAIVSEASSVPTITNPQFCAPFVANSGVTADYGSSITWSNGVSIAQYLGIDLSSKTGYTTSAKNAYKFTKAVHLCGTGGVPSQGSGGSPNPYLLVVTA